MIEVLIDQQTNKTGSIIARDERANGAERVVRTNLVIRARHDLLRLASF